MLKNLALLVAGLALGLAVVMLNREPSSGDPVSDESLPGMNADHARAVADLHDRFDDLDVRFAALEERVAELAGGAAGSGSAPERASPGAEVSAIRTLTRQPPLGQPQGQAQSREELVEQLIAGGFSRQRAEWIAQLSEDLVMDLLEARYEAERSGEPFDETANPQSTLRGELGDAEYERYLTATGRESEVGIIGLFENSPAALAGLRVGDRIVSYAGQRVFSIQEVVDFTLQGTRGESVIIEILRNGQPMQIVVPRGPLGVNISSETGVTR